MTAFVLSPEKDEAGHLQSRQKAQRVSLCAGSEKDPLGNVVPAPSSLPPPPPLPPAAPPPPAGPLFRLALPVKLLFLSDKGNLLIFNAKVY